MNQRLSLTISASAPQTMVDRAAADPLNPDHPIFNQGAYQMKTNKIIRRIDNSLFQLQEAHSLLETKVESADAARVVAVMMQPALDDLFNILERLMDKGGSMNAAGRDADHV